MKEAKTVIGIIRRQARSEDEEKLEWLIEVTYAREGMRDLMGKTIELLANDDAVREALATNEGKKAFVTGTLESWHWPLSGDRQYIHTIKVGSETQFDIEKR
jgi:hypothetical protein